MTDASKIKTPKDVTDFEREQLRFFLTRDDLAAVLTDLNPSLAWLPLLAELKLINADTQLAMWLEKNFADLDTVRDVVANIHFFRPDTADILEFGFDRQVPRLSPLLAKSWRLILRHMRNSKRGVLRDAWFSLAPRLKRGEHSPEVLERLADVLKPKPVVSKRFSLNDDDGSGLPERPSDLMSIVFEAEDGVSEDEVLSVWPEDASAQLEEKLLKILTSVLSSAVEDAIDAEVESNTSYGATDSDVPSIAQHHQNEYRKGFLPIVRVIAEIWMRLSKKDPQLALPFVSLWQVSALRLVRRLALFASANLTVPSDSVAHLLLTLPIGEYFVTNSSVEVFRVMHARWHDLPVDKQQAVECRICEGPPPDWFKEGADKERIIDRCRFDLLGDLKRSGITLSAVAENQLQQIRARYPNWELKPAEQAGFHIWHEGSHGIVGDPAKLENVPDDELVIEAKRIAERADFMDGDAWQAFCQTDPQRALRGLEAQAAANEWQAWAWRPFLWAATKNQNLETVTRIAKLLLSFPEDQLSTNDMAQAASWWLNENVKSLDNASLWPLWDRLEKAAPRDEEEASNE